MKTTLLTTLFLATITLFAQENKNKVFYLDSLHNITSEKKIFYTRIVEDYNSKKDLYVVTDYYHPSGKINMNATSKNKDNLRLEGTRIDYYENGNKKQESNYIDNKLNGKQISWYENSIKKSEKEITWDAKNKSSDVKILQFWNPDGTQTVIDGNGQYEYSDDKISEKGELKNGKKQGTWEGKDLKDNFSYKELYKDGDFISGISTDENNNKFPYKQIIEKPTPAKGLDDFYIFIGKNFKTPKDEKINGKIYTKFIIDKSGKLTDVKTVKGIREDLDTQAIKVIYQYGNWIPGKRKGISINTPYNFPITIQPSPSTQNN